MEKYNIQIEDSEKSWIDTPVKEVSFETRAKAIDFCKKLSYVLDSKIRLSQGKLEGSQGTYIG